MNIHERVERLERVNRRLMAGIVALGIFLICGAMQCTPERLSVAKEIKVGGSEGEGEIVLSVSKKATGIAVLDEKGKLRLMLGLAKREVGVSVFDDDSAGMTVSGRGLIKTEKKPPQ
jgi:hypothetical protein